MIILNEKSMCEYCFCEIKVAKYSGNGGHEINEDSYLIADGVYVVADGLGGHENGEVASYTAVKYMESHLPQIFTKESINSLLEGTNEAVVNLKSDARTTVAAAFAQDGYFFYANVGDSRVYYFKNNSIYAQTKDHSVCQTAVDMGMMEFSEIRTSEDRCKLLKVLGDEESLNLKKFYEPIAIEPGDAFLICSDGFWEFVLEEEMEVDLLKSQTVEEWVNYMLKRQLRRAKNEDDNYTVICGIFEETTVETPKKKWYQFFKKGNR